MKAAEIVSGFISKGRTLVFIDQPTIVPNETGSRPVEKLAASVISYIGGGVQPSNRGKVDMFGDDAPIWTFLKALNLSLNPVDAFDLSKQGAVMEVFPALALPSFNAQFFGRYKAPKYNPSNRRKFKIEDWKEVCLTALRVSESLEVMGLQNIIQDLMKLERPSKADQDRLDGILCALIGLNWMLNGETKTIQFGNISTGFMVTPCSDDVRTRLEGSRHFNTGFIQNLSRPRLN